MKTVTGSLTVQFTEPKTQNPESGIQTPASRTCRLPISGCPSPASRTRYATAQGATCAGPLWSSCATPLASSPLAVPLAHLAFGSVTREPPRMPGPRVVTRVTLELLSTSAFMENITVASEGSAACGPTLAILNQTNQNFKPKSQTVKPKLQKTASFSCFSAIWFTVSGFRVQTVKPNR